MRLQHMTPVLALMFALCVECAFAGADAFHAGPLIPDYGPVATVDATMAIPSDMTLRLVFDNASGAGVGTPNAALISAARFLNMHAEAGIPVERIKVAIVLHGTAVHDVTAQEHYGEVYGGAANASAPLVAQLLGYGARIIVCGQSAAYQDVETNELLDGVEMAVSAMTAHAVLQHQGYALNPF